MVNGHTKVKIADGLMMDVWNVIAQNQNQKKRKRKMNKYTIKIEFPLKNPIEKWKNSVELQEVKKK